jgi:hypothetical protein
MANEPLPNPLGRLALTPALRALQPGSKESGLVVSAIAEVPVSGSEPQHAWDVAWADAAKEAVRLGADEPTANALAQGAGETIAAGARAVVAAHGQVLLSKWLAPGSANGAVRVGQLPYLLDVADAIARQPARVIVLADRHGAAVVAQAAGDEYAPLAFPLPARPGALHDPHQERPPALHHGERHLTDSEPESGGDRNARFIAARVTEAASSVGARIVLGVGDQHVLDAVSPHLPGALGPVTIAAITTLTWDHDNQVSAEARISVGIEAALRQITTAAVDSVADLVAAAAAAPEPGAVIGIEAVAGALASEQVAALLVAADIGEDNGAADSRIGSAATQFAVDGEATPVLPVDGLVWAALRQDAIVLRLSGRVGPLAGQPVAALLRHGVPRHRP